MKTEDKKKLGRKICTKIFMALFVAFLATIYSVEFDTIALKHFGLSTYYTRSDGYVWYSSCNLHHSRTLLFSKSKSNYGNWASVRF